MRPRHIDLPCDLLRQAFDRLPDKFRQPLYLVRVERLTHAQAAARLGISLPELDRRLARALARLDHDLERLKWHQWRRW
jgi:DNA-directed RNA polymerase specialized sigma24 family protein